MFCVIPTQVGISASYYEIPAFASMTHYLFYKISAFAEMTDFFCMEMTRKFF